MQPKYEEALERLGERYPHAADLADVADVHVQTVRRWRAGKSTPQGDNRRKLIEAYDRERKEVDP